MKLRIELVPKSSWYKNLRKHISKKEWDAIRKTAYKKSGYKCEICNSSGRLYCHEIWRYNDSKNIQTLNGFQTLCEKCHHLKHLGLVNVKIASNELSENYMEMLINHFCKVNKCSRKDFEEHRNNAYKKWVERSKKHWRVDFEIWENIIKKKQLTLSGY